MTVCVIPVIILFGMGYDWGRWVNITYVFLALVYFKLLIDSRIEINFKIIHHHKIIIHLQ